jgi:chromosome segregation ATPase
MRLPRNHILGIRAALIALSGLVLCSCAGDPTTGGIFWSESKAKSRLVALRGELAQENKLLAQARAQRTQERRSLNRDLSSIRTKLASAKRQDARLTRELSRIQSASDALELSEADSAAEVQRQREKIAALQGEVGELRQKNEALQTSF